MNPRTTIALLSLALLAASCSDDPVSPVADMPPRTFDVEWKSSVVYFDSTALGDIASLDTTNYTYRFIASSSRASSLTAGSVIVVHGQAIRRVTKVTSAGGAIIVETEDADLTDAIQNGRIGWNYAASYDNAITPAIMIDGREHAMARVSTGTADYTYKITIGAHKYELKMKSNGGKIEVNCTIADTASSGVTSEYRMKGTVEQIRSQNQIDFKDGAITNVDYKNRNVRGTLSVGMSVKGGVKDYGLKLPAVLLKWPFLVGPIPIVLNVKMEWAVTAQIPLGGKAEVTSTFSFDSETGFSYDGVDFTAHGVIGPWRATTDTAKSGAVGALAAEFAIGFPQVEVEILAKTFVAYARPTFLVRGDFSVSGLDGSTCQTAKAVFAGVAGVRLSALGIKNLGERQIQLWSAEKQLLKEGKCN